MANVLEVLWNRKSVAEQHATVIVGEVHAAAVNQISGLGRVAPEDFTDLIRDLSRPYTIEGGLIDQSRAEYGLRPGQIRRIKSLVARACFDGSNEGGNNG